MLGLIIACALALALPGVSLADSFTVYSATGADASAIAPVVNAFRTVLGNNNGNTAGQQASGRREINWDGGGAGAAATVFPVPMTTFNSGGTTRGAVFSTPGTGFEISGQPTPEFGDLDPSYPGSFVTFSAPRLFTPLGSNVTETHFFIAGTDTPAKVTAFGAVFTDVDLPESTSVEYLDGQGTVLGKLFVPPANNGLSFVGVVFATDRVATVRITSGTAGPGASVLDGGAVDVVVMDDFIYSEPSVIGPPTEADQCKKGGWETFDFPRTFTNQGDCIQFVKTGR